jgi:parvulin-like peptidyl-prolyl isomerase
MQKFSEEIKISEKEQKKFFNENKEKFTSTEELKARHILVKSEAEAKTLITTLNKAKDVEAKFIELAKTKSTGPSGRNGGDLGWFPLNKMVPEFSKAAAKLKVKSFTKEPVKTQFGYHVIYLEDRKGAKEVTFNAVQDQIKQMMAQEKFSKELQDLAAKLKKKAKIEYK